MAEILTIDRTIELLQQRVPGDDIDSAIAHMRALHRMLRETQRERDKWKNMAARP